MDGLPVEVFGLVLEHVCSLNDLGALWLVNRRTAQLCGSIRGKTLWRITYRTCWSECLLHEEVEEGMGSPCNASVVAPALYHSTSGPFKVRAWLYRRASRRSFGRSEEGLGGCVIRDGDCLENVYDRFCFHGFHGGGKLASWPDDSDDWGSDGEDEKGREWRKVWLEFKRHLVMQRVQRVNQGDGTVKAWWKRSYEGNAEEKKKKKKISKCRCYWFCVDGNAEVDRFRRM